jgi:hypothetical protein
MQMYCNIEIRKLQTFFRILKNKLENMLKIFKFYCIMVRQTQLNPNRQKTKPLSDVWRFRS